MDKSGWGLRVVRDVDVAALRIFILSVLWRCAASNVHGFEEIELSEDDLEYLRELVVKGHATSIEDFPVSLIQIATLGLPHNQTPLLEKKKYPEAVDGRKLEEPFFRFYFDGLIVHVGTKPRDRDLLERQGKLALGVSPDLHLLTVDYEVSFQRQNVENIAGDAFANWDSDIQKIMRH